MMQLLRIVQAAIKFAVWVLVYKFLVASLHATVLNGGKKKGKTKSGSACN